MKIVGEVPLEDIDRRLGGALSTPGKSTYCYVCDGLRPVDHVCICPLSRKPVAECVCCFCAPDGPA